MVGRAAPHADLSSGNEHDGAGGGRISAGVAGQRLPVVPIPAVATRPAVAVTTTASTASSAPASSAPARITDEQLRSADKAHIAWVTPSGSQTPTVQVELMSPTPMNIVGAPGDADVQRALTFFLENGQRFDPDVRLDSLDVLRMKPPTLGCRRACASPNWIAIPACASRRSKRFRDLSRIPRFARPFSMRWKATPIPACVLWPSIFSSPRCNPKAHRECPAHPTRKRWTCCATACEMTPAHRSPAKRHGPREFAPSSTGRVPVLLILIRWPRFSAHEPRRPSRQPHSGCDP